MYNGDRYYDFTDEHEVYKAIDTLNKRIKTYEGIARDVVQDLTSNFDALKTKSGYISKSKKAIKAIQDNIVLINELGMRIGHTPVITTYKEELKQSQKIKDKQVLAEDVRDITISRLKSEAVSSLLAIIYGKQSESYNPRDELMDIAPELFKDNRKTSKMSYSELSDVYDKLKEYV